MDHVIGTCGNCGGCVSVPAIWGGIHPPTSRCQSCDSHWYLIPHDKRGEWNAWCDLDPDSEEAWEAPSWAKPLGTGPQNFTFTDPQEINR
jgi:hypothetical protein